VRRDRQDRRYASRYGNNGGSIKGILSNWIVKNLLLAVIFVAALMIAGSLFMTCTTKHGQQNPVPDFSGMSLKEAGSLSRSEGLRIDVVDSIYVKRMPRGSVVRQEPKPGAMVKSGRRIQLTINAVSPKQVPMPNLVGYSLRSAKAELDSRGFTLGKLIYIQDMATNNVLRQLYRNSEIRPGKMLPSESRVDLVLGLDPNDNVTSVPRVLGSKYRNAVDLIQNNSLNVGSVVYDKSVKNYQDSLSAVVYNQSPDASVQNILMGRNVSIYLTVDENKIYKAGLTE